MKRIISIILCMSFLFTGCSSTKKQNESSISENANVSDEIVFEADKKIEFNNLSDPALLQYVEDNVYSNLVSELDNENYIIENVVATYVSDEYLKEVEYNSQKNIYFGYTLAELDEQFKGSRYVFTLGDNGKTTVKEFEEYDDTYEKVIKNIAIGTGVILVCVTVSVVSGGVGAPAAVSMVFATAAKTGTIYAISSGTISAVAAGTITGFKTGDIDESLKAAVLVGSEGFKWGAITGVIEGGAGKAIELFRSSRTIPTPRKSELTVLERTKNSTEQVSYLDKVEVPTNTLNATRPDVVVKNSNGTVHAIEVKNYNLSNSSNRHTLFTELERQVTSRIKNLPTGSTQEIVLDVRGRNYSKELIDSTIKTIKYRLANIYPDIPINVLAY